VHSLDPVPLRLPLSHGAVVSTESGLVGGPGHYLNSRIEPRAGILDLLRSL
jgi:hypothetical protein